MCSTGNNPHAQANLSNTAVAAMNSLNNPASASKPQFPDPSEVLKIPLTPMPNAGALTTASNNSKLNP
jgi:hypothetical protein